MALSFNVLDAKAIALDSQPVLHAAFHQMDNLIANRVMKKLTLPTRLYLIGTFILIAGLGAAALVSMMAEDDGNDAAGREFGGGQAYATSPIDSKPFIHDLELYGGKGAVLAVEFDRWFERLWQGRQLAHTLAWLAVGLATACFLAANHLSDQLPGEHDDG